jgi:hypothetical protein
LLMEVPIGSQLTSVRKKNAAIIDINLLNRIMIESPIYFLQ